MSGPTLRDQAIVAVAALLNHSKFEVGDVYYEQAACIVDAATMADPDLDLLGRFSIAAEGQDDDVIMRCARADCSFEVVESGNAPASDLLVEAREHWRAEHASSTA